MKTLTTKINIRSLTAAYALVSVLAVPCLAADPNYTPGQSYFGRNNYIEYIAGNAPVIFTVPHGGALTPDEIPDRTVGTMATDRNTAPLAHSFIRAFHDLTGLYPHVVFCHLKRTKFDANRDIAEAAQGNEHAQQAWRDWHRFIDTAKAIATRDAASALFIDLHGHGHPVDRLELGYNLTGSHLELGDDRIDRHTDRSSLRALAAASERTFADLLRGPQSFGALMHERGFPAVPSPHYPDPGGEPYFYSGYNTRRHTSDPAARVSGFQLECNFRGFRDTKQNREKAAAALSDAIVDYLHLNHNIALERRPQTPTQLADVDAK
jgi:hypothetical protein